MKKFVKEFSKKFISVLLATTMITGNISVIYAEQSSGIDLEGLILEEDTNLENTININEINLIDNEVDVDDSTDNDDLNNISDEDEELIVNSADNNEVTTPSSTDENIDEKITKETEENLSIIDEELEEKDINKREIENFLTQKVIFDDDKLKIDTESDIQDIYGLSEKKSAPMLRSFSLNTAPTNPTKEFEREHIKLILEEEDVNSFGTGKLEWFLDTMDSAAREIKNLTGIELTNKIVIKTDRNLSILASMGNEVVYNRDYFLDLIWYDINNDRVSSHIDILAYSIVYNNLKFHQLHLPFSIKHLYEYYVVENNNLSIRGNGESTVYQGSNYIKYYEKEYENSTAKDIFVDTGLTYNLLKIKEEIGWEAFEHAFQVLRGFAEEEKEPWTYSDLYKLNAFLTLLFEYSNFDIFKLFTINELNVYEKRFRGEIKNLTADNDDDLTKIKIALNNLEINFSGWDSYDSVTQNISLSDTSENNLNIVWSSNNNSLITSNGKVTRPNISSENVILTATVSSGNEELSKTFNVKVIKNNLITENDLEDYTKEQLESLDDNIQLYIGKNGELTSIDGTFTSFLVESPEEAILAIYNVKSLMKLNNPKLELVWNSSLSNDLSRTHIFKQVYNGIEVFGRNISITTDLEGNTISLSSGYLPEIIINTNPTLTKEQASEIAKTYFSGTLNIVNAELSIYSLNNINETLTWKVDLIGNDNENNFIDSAVFVDAHTGEQIKILTNIYNERVPDSGNDEAGTEHFFHVERKKGFLSDYTYEMQDTDRNIEVYNTTDPAKPPGRLYKRTHSAIWNDGASVSGIANVSKVYDYFKDKFKWSSFNGKGNKITVSIHNYSNGNNSAFSPSSDMLRFGDPTTPLANNGYINNGSFALDTVAHEYMHGIFKYRAPNMPYQDEPGAINEGYADIFGYFAEGKNDPDWLHREDNTHGNIALRSMSNPHSFNQPSAVGDSFYHDYTTNSSDNGGVHRNNTIISHAAYLMWSNGINDKDRLAKLWWHSLDYSYDGTSTFLQVRRNILKSAKHLKFAQNEINIIKDAFDTVNVRENLSFSGKICKTKTSLTGSDIAISNASLTISSSSFSRTVNTNNNGEFLVDNLTDGTYNVKVLHNDYKELNFEITLVNLDSINNSYYLDIKQESKLSGKIVEADEDNDLTNNIPLSNATINIERITGTEKIIKSTSTDNNGLYEFTQLPAGIYKIKINKIGFIEVTQEVTVKENQNTIFNTSIEAISTEYFGYGTASGSVTDAITGKKVRGLTLKIRSGLNNVNEGEIFQELKTDDLGNYKTKELPAGNYCIEVIDERDNIKAEDRYLDSQINIKILGLLNIPFQNGSVTTTLSDKQVRVVLKWGSSPRDLDSHLTGPTQNGGRFHIYYSSKTYLENGVRMADLDLDDIDGYGPETTTIYTPIDGIYRFSVLDFTNRSSVGSSALSNSGATVEVYIGVNSTPEYRFSVPQLNGMLWTVFEYNSTTGTITPINTIDDSRSPRSFIQNDKQLILSESEKNIKNNFIENDNIKAS